ncbi:hypothetical protein LMF89_12235 [Pelosinus sp. Bkl1]|uniref:Uncharacterized protein n=1 Tax=Pelosinus baikalensis TaxID=2892015 RepID=A0ABS8HUB7_9FIRM|nr:hypothetical protein [Pelosinus baikalensis]
MLTKAISQEWLDLYQESVKIVEDIEQRNVVPKYLEKEELALFLKTAREKGIEDDYEFFFNTCLY